MANSVSSTNVTVKASQEGEKKPYKKVSTILHRLPTVVTETKVKDLEEPKKREISIKTSSKRYRPDDDQQNSIEKVQEKSTILSQKNTTMLLPGSQPLSIHQQNSINEYYVNLEIEKERNFNKLRTMFSTFTDFNAHVQFLRDKGITVNPHDVNQLNIFETKKKVVESFLAKKGMRYNPVSFQLSKENKVLTYDETVVFMNELFANVENETDLLKNDTILTLLSIATFHGFLNDLKSRRWMVNEEVQCLDGPRGEFFTFEEMRETVFQPRKDKFELFLTDLGFFYNSNNDSICAENGPIGMEIVDNLVRAFICFEKEDPINKPQEVAKQEVPKLDYSQLPDFEIIKSTFAMILDFDEFLGILKDREWKFTETGDLISPQGKFYKLNSLKDEWEKNRSQLLNMAGGAAKLDQFYNSMKDSILSRTVRDAMDQFGMTYDREMKAFVNGHLVQTIEEMAISITLKEIRLL